MNAILKNPFFRKSLAIGKQIPRLVKRTKSDPDDYKCNPPVIANSFPKSGTHLLLQILEQLPGLTNYGSFIASRNSSAGTLFIRVCRMLFCGTLHRPGIGRRGGRLAARAGLYS